jgi:hypothetical protein
LWSGTKWEKLDFGRVFFRADGGLAKAFGSGVQADMIKAHTITGGNHNHGFTISNNATEAGDMPRRASSNRNATGYTNYSGDLKMTYGNATNNPETRPINYTIQIWKRIV